mgnify:FL=1
MLFRSQLEWLNAALPPDYRLTTVASTDNWVLFGTRAQSVETVTLAADGNVVIARPVTPGMRIAVDGKNVAYSTLDGVLPVVRASSGEAKSVTISYRLPHENFIFALMALGFFALAWLALAARRR